MWPVQTAGKSCSESGDVLAELTSQECPYPCSRDKARFACQIKCVKNDGCVGINYSKTMNQFMNYCGICTSNKLQSSTFGFEFYQKPKGNYKDLLSIQTISFEIKALIDSTYLNEQNPLSCILVTRHEILELSKYKTNRRL